MEELKDTTWAGFEPDHATQSPGRHQHSTQTSLECHAYCHRLIHDNDTQAKPVLVCTTGYMGLLLQYISHQSGCRPGDCVTRARFELATRPLTLTEQRVWTHTQCSIWYCCHSFRVWVSVYLKSMAQPLQNDTFVEINDDIFWIFVILYQARLLLNVRSSLLITFITCKRSIFVYARCSDEPSTLYLLSAGAF